MGNDCSLDGDLRIDYPSTPWFRIAFRVRQEIITRVHCIDAKEVPALSVASAGVGGVIFDFVLPPIVKNLNLMKVEELWWRRHRLPFVCLENEVPHNHHFYFCALENWLSTCRRRKDEDGEWTMNSSPRSARSNNPVHTAALSGKVNIEWKWTESNSSYYCEDPGRDRRPLFLLWKALYVFSIKAREIV